MATAKVGKRGTRETCAQGNKVCRLSYQVKIPLFARTPTVYVFKQAGTKKVCNLAQVISAPDDAVRFSSVIIDGSGKTIAVGANGDDAVLGATFIYRYSRATKQYELVQKIRATDNLAGAAFGISLSLSASGKVLAVGAEGADNGNGAVFM
jgi:hypothetical protein